MQLAIPPDDVPVEMAEIGKPSDVVASSVNELDINSLMGIVLGVEGQG